jgi:serine/threonine-protein kinase
MVSRRVDGECNESRLRSFLDDNLAEPDNVQLVQHLDRCAGCRRTLERLAAESRLWAELRQLAPECGPAPPAGQFEPQAVGTSQQSRPSVEGDIPLDFLARPGTPGSLGRLGQYEVTGVLGRGGFGVVLKAQDPALNRIVAIKVLSAQLAANAAARSRFAREAKAAAAVVHDNVVAVHAVDSWNSLPYMVMSYVAGQSLQQRVDRDGPLPIKEVLRIGMQAARGLAAAHDQGLVHRDVKPSNILLENSVERVKLSDFGLARAVDDVSLTQSGVVSGTPQYMSPEQARGAAVDHRSDLFSLGSTLYFMCAGHPPFRADSTPAVLRRVCDERPRPLREINSDVPAWLAEIVERLHAKEPDGRYGSATEVADLLQHHLAELQRTGTSAPPRRLPTVPIRKSLGRKSPAAVVPIVAVLLCIGVIGAGSAVWSYRSWMVQAAEAAPAWQAVAERDEQPMVVKEVISKSFRTGRTPRLIVDLFNGGIDLVADSASRVDVRVTKQGSGESDKAAQAALQNVDVKMVQDGEDVRVTAKRIEEARKTNSGASAEVHVPTGAIVELHTSNGGVKLQGGSGKAQVQTSNGAVEVKQRKGPLHLRTSNGAITIAGGTGAMDLQTSNGAITIEADPAELAAHTSNGSIRFRGFLTRGEHSLHTSNGSIVLTMPANAQFRFDAQTSRGKIVNAFAKERPTGKPKNHLVGTIGENPSASIQLRTSNGDITLRPQEPGSEKQ